MKKMTSAVANKLLRSLEEEKNFWVNQENSSRTYTAAVNEEPVIPEYDYQTVADKIAAIDAQVCVIRHAINRSNVLAEIPVGDQILSVDTILVRMAQLNKRKDTLDYMRRQLPQTRLETRAYTTKTPFPEYQYINYDLELVKREYERISDEVMALQIALDKYNQTVEFEVEI